MTAPQPPAPPTFLKPKITITIESTDNQGNRILSEETRVFSGSNPPAVVEYCKVFTNVLNKQEFANEEIQEGLKNYFIETEKEMISK